MPQFTSAAELVEMLPQAFNADKARGDKAVLAFQLSGDNGGHFWLRINDGTLETGHGEPPAEADLIIRASAADFLAIMNREMNPMTAFMAGKIKAERNMGLAMKLMSWFGMN
jgi:putative sterol carrier protein